jgi:hypothetical protein
VGNITCIIERRARYRNSEGRGYHPKSNATSDNIVYIVTRPKPREDTSHADMQ